MLFLSTQKDTFCYFICLASLSWVVKKGLESHGLENRSVPLSFKGLLQACCCWVPVDEARLLPAPYVGTWLPRREGKLASECTAWLPGWCGCAGRRTGPVCIQSLGLYYSGERLRSRNSVLLNVHKPGVARLIDFVSLPLHVFLPALTVPN